MKKILIAQKNIKNMRSGIPRLVTSEVKFFSARGHCVNVVSEKVDVRTLKNSGAEVQKTLSLPVSGYLRRKFFNWQVSRLVARMQPDLVIGHGDIIQQDICFIHNCVHLAHELIHGRPLPEEHEVGRIHTEILTSKKFKLLVCNSQLMKRDLISRFGLIDRQVVVHYPELDQKKFGRDRADIRGELDISQETVVIGLITSGDFAKRNVQLLLEASLQLPAERNLHFIIAGKDDSERFKELAAKSPHCVTFLPAINEVEQYYNSVDIFVLPAHIEEFGMSVLEAMACRKPVIVSPTVGAAEILEDDSRSFILPELTIQNLVEKLLLLIDNPGLRQRLGAENQRVASKYSSDAQDSSFTKLLDGLQG